jgi:hypothetical protein
MEEQGKGGKPESFLDWMDFKKVVTKNKDTLLATYGLRRLPALGKEWGNSHAQQLNWFDEINSKVRQFVGHSSKGSINKQGFELVREVSDVIKKNIDDDRSKWS